MRGNYGGESHIEESSWIEEEEDDLIECKEQGGTNIVPLIARECMNI